MSRHRTAVEWHARRQVLTAGSAALVPVLALSLAVSGPALSAESRCDDGERAIWWCESGRKSYVLCASADLSAQGGYMQYRVHDQGSTEFVFPANRVHPRDKFALSLMPRGASLSFRNDGYEYGIYEPLSGQTQIDVTRDGRVLSSRTCRTASDTLTLTDVQAFARTIGVFR